MLALRKKDFTVDDVDDEQIELILASDASGDPRREAYHSLIAAYGRRARWHS